MFTYAEVRTLSAAFLSAVCDRRAKARSNNASTRWLRVPVAACGAAVQPVSHLRQDTAVRPGDVAP